VSKFCGIWHFDRRPASREDGRHIQIALGCPGFTAPQEHREPGLLMGWAAGAETPSRSGLCKSPDRSICLWDGRLDNRKDLLRQMGLEPGCSDGELVLDLYRKRAVDGLRDVVGDWSLCIWDANRREIVLASDYAGVRPLYYHLSPDRLVWSSSLADLVRWTGITTLDDIYVASFLARGAAQSQTPYAGISAVPAGHAVSISADGILKRAFWNLPIHRSLRYQDERQYEERMLELFREAVQVRMNTSMSVCAELSGGLDSSSVVCMADRLRREAVTEVPGLITFSYTHEQNPDEKYFREVERVCQLSGCHLQLRDFPAVSADQAGAAPAWWVPRFQRLAGRMAAAKAGVLLTGQLGDFVMGNTPDGSGQVTEWLAKGCFTEAAREAYAWGRSMQVPVYPILWRSICEAYFSRIPPTDPRDAVGALRGSTEDSLVQSLRTRIDWHERERLGDNSWRHAPPGRRQRFRGAGEILRDRTLQVPEALQHISYTHPYSHRPLVEFMLTIPASVVCRPDQPRRLMRRAFAGLLPRLVVERKSKATYASTFLQALLPLAGTLLKRPSEIQLVERGYVDRSSLIHRLEKLRQGLECNESQLRRLILLEFWLRNHSAFQDPLPSPTLLPELATV